MNIFLSFFVPSSKHNILLLKYTCVEFVSIKRLWKNQIKKLGKQKYPSFQKHFSTRHKGIGGRKKKEKISKSKTMILVFFDNLKNKQQYQGCENFCHSKKKKKRKKEKKKICHKAYKNIFKFSRIAFQ